MQRQTCASIPNAPAWSHLGPLVYEAQQDERLKAKGRKSDM